MIQWNVWNPDPFIVEVKKLLYQKIPLQGQILEMIPRDKGKLIEAIREWIKVGR